MPKMLRPILTDVEKAAQDGIEKAARETLARARERVPVRTGRLKRSGRVVADDLTATVRFTAPYSFLVHERLDFQHPKGGQAKFLENAALEVDVGQIVAAAVRAQLGG
ncbi:hypothetical protein C5B92_07070 [Rathayibacter sp. AY1A4]|uniref:HK97 gp10 family phage protein n=1 Tax=Rathayibacter sp. AY1A4 TaxID=2080522 RepID=UPI000CE7B70A|nr:HK97 gp10 family phage protein [Rathayibacter sp. AY1A4]PPF18269.1 hypothetical protein C5B92_07070 [Rathayibacter sp. AY1A4]